MIIVDFRSAGGRIDYVINAARKIGYLGGMLDH